ncbi:sigma-70 family RNA polymerase sigma factor family protein [Haloactinospora alba]|uniref:hypothetical protein n=1 Tax=Haloactinospora alba TaxID=405555 RepID=UPI001FE5BC99|nr:hypothetical protein [Haloactinospora alba]
MDRTEAGARQLAHRARQRLARADGQRGGVSGADPATHARLTEAFAAAYARGDVETLRRILAEDAVTVNDGGGRASAARNPVYGADRSARFLAGIATRFPVARLERTEFNGAPGVLAIGTDGGVRSAAVAHVSGGRVRRLYMVRTPDKLSTLRARGAAADPGRR